MLVLFFLLICEAINEKIILNKNLFSFSFLYCEQRKENETKEKKQRTVFNNLRLNKYAGKPARSRSLRNARDVLPC